MNIPQIILGLDPGFGRLGFGFLSAAPGQTSVLDYGIISTSPQISFEKRLRQIGEDLETLINGRSPHLVGVEKLYFAKNTKTAMRVAEARGVILFICAKHDVPVVEFTPAQIKKSLTGHGAADKKAIQWMVKEILKLKNAPRLDDAADALAAALTASSVKW